MADKAAKRLADEKLKAAYEEYYVSIYRYCLSKLKDNEAAEDCVQDAFLVLYRKYLAGEEIISIKAFLMKTASNYVLKRFDEKKKAQATVDIDEIINIPAQSDDVDEKLVFDEYTRQISAALSTLDSRIFTMRYNLDYKIEDIARALDMTTPSVAMRLSRMKSKLREIFKDELNGS